MDHQTKILGYLDAVAHGKFLGWENFDGKKVLAENVNSASLALYELEGEIYCYTCDAAHDQVEYVDFSQN